MTPTFAHLNDLTSDDWAAVDAVVERFETAWHRGERPPLDPHLPAGGLRRAALQEIVRGELEVRLKAGEAARVENYLQQFPEIAADANLVLGLLAQEHELRQRREPHLALDEYQRRFPQHAAALAARLSSPDHTSVAAQPPVAPVRTPSPAIDSGVTLVAVLTEGRLLEPSQLVELASLQAVHADPRPLARELVQRGWLTPWQVNQLFLRRAGELRLGPYLLLDRLGEGGMGTVYRARHSVMRRLVALKVIRRDRLANTDMVRRFYREVRAVARLSHPNIVLAHDAAQVDGTHFLVMEFVDGEDLARVVRQRGALPVAEACEYVRQAALGLQHAHEQGLVHRDVKPGNLLLGRTAAGGTIKVLDLGLARLAQAAGEQTAGELTGAGGIVGTPDYLAPEQARESHTADVRADVYSLGCTLYFLLTGRVPFPGGTFAQKVLRHEQANAVPVEQVRPEVPAALGAVVKKLMAKRPEDRCQTPLEVAAALLPFCPPGAALSGTVPVPVVVVPVLATAVPASEGTVAAATAGVQTIDLTGQGAAAGEQTQPLLPPAPSPGTLARVGAWVRHSPRRAAAIASGALLLVCLLLFLRGGSGGGGGADDPDGGGGAGARWPLDNLKPVVPAAGQLDWLPEGLVTVLGSARGRHWGPVRAVAFSPDGKLVASGGDDELICVWQADTLEEYRLLRGHKGPVRSLAFTPDGRLLSGGADRTVRLWDVKRRKEVLKLEGHTDPVACLAVSVDGTRALSGGAGAVDCTVRLWSLAGAGQELAVFRGHTEEVTQVGFLPNGKQVISGDSKGGVFAWDVATRAKARQVSVGQGDYSPRIVAFTPDGRWAFTDAPGEGEADRWDASTGKLVDRIVVPLANMGSISPDGRFAGFARRDTVSVCDALTWKVLRVFKANEVFAIALAPDGRRVVSGNMGGVVQIWDVQSGKEITPRPGHTFAVHAVTIAKDGRRVLTGGADKTVRLWDLASSPPGQEVKRLEGHAGTVTRVVFVEGGQRGASTGADGTTRCWDLASGKEQRRLEEAALGFSADGRLAAVQRLNRATVLVLATGEEIRTAVYGKDKSITAAALTPDGRRLALLYSYLCMVWDFRSASKEHGLNLGSRPVIATVFSPDGESLLLGDDGGGMRLLDLATLKQDGRPRALAGIVTPISGVAWSPSGKLAAGSSSSGKIMVWDVATGQPLQEWQLPGAVHGIAFAPDGRHLLTANGNGTAYVIRLRSAP
ncbi:MAG: serine/threonine protein kinase [Gemmataceae bacterium]|nr:serine/threonine protein kinase [Gemmataceae bacterium]